MRSVSPESENIYDFIVALHQTCGGDYCLKNLRPDSILRQPLGDYSKLKVGAGFSEEDVKNYLSYATQFLGNGGTNYKSFGDSKFLPRLNPEKFGALAKFSPAAGKHYNLFKDALYETKAEGLMHLGYPPTHLTNCKYS